MYYKIVLSGTKQPITITEEKREELSRILSSPRKPKFITIEDEILNTNFIVAVLKDHERNRLEAYNKRIGMEERKELPKPQRKKLNQLKKRMSPSPQEKTKAKEEAARKIRKSK